MRLALQQLRLLWRPSSSARRLHQHNYAASKETGTSLLLVHLDVRTPLIGGREARRFGDMKVEERQDE